MAVNEGLRDIRYLLGMRKRNAVFKSGFDGLTSSSSSNFVSLRLCRVSLVFKNGVVGSIQLWVPSILRCFRWLRPTRSNHVKSRLCAVWHRTYRCQLYEALECWCTSQSWYLQQVTVIVQSRIAQSFIKVLKMKRILNKCERCERLVKIKTWNSMEPPSFLIVPPCLSQQFIWPCLSYLTLLVEEMLLRRTDASLNRPPAKHSYWHKYLHRYAAQWYQELTLKSPGQAHSGWQRFAWDRWFQPDL